MPSPVPPAVADYAIEERQELLDQIAGLRRALTAFYAVLELPAGECYAGNTERLKELARDAGRWRFCAPLLAEQLGTSVAALGDSVDGLRAEEARGVKP